MGSVSPTALRGCWAAGWRGDWSCCCRRVPQSAPKGLFLFWENPPAQSCCFIQGRSCRVAQPTSLARPGTVRVRAPHSPTLNSPQAVPMVFGVFTILLPYSPPCDLKQPGLSPCCSSLVWQGGGGELLTWLSPRSPTGPEGEGLGLQSPLSLN